MGGIERCPDRGKACQEGRDKAKRKRDEDLKAASNIIEGTVSALKQPKEKVSPPQDRGFVTPQQLNNFPRASPSSSGYTLALEGLVDEYRKRIVKLKIEIEDLKEDRMTLASDKNKLLPNFAQIQAQYGQAVGRLQIFE